MIDIHNNDALTKRVNELKCKLQEIIAKGFVDGCITELNAILVTAGAGRVKEFKESNQYGNNLIHHGMTMTVSYIGESF